ncbi:branched-subunit amino acid transport protein AzlD [Microbacteriaceae bacterium MWH-Ta3]|nr:branched-subunit amino acid transport protein AzlD [Microbacteriaceae bacterium MWH-Ta3]
MSLWMTIITASVAVLALKLIGYVVPRSFGEHPTVQNASSILTIALLASLVTTQTLGSATGFALDARVVAIVLAGVLLWLRAPFIVVVIAGAASAAVLRATGLMP